MLALDIPIGLPADGAAWPRQADIAARNLLGARRASIFLAPPRPVLDCASYDLANRVHRELTGKGLSRQSWGLAQKILEAEAFLDGSFQAIEVHPEVSFQAMNGAPLEQSKKTWNGQMARRELLRDHGIIVPDRIDQAGDVPPDDLLDAAAAAWTAWRASRGLAEAVSRPGKAQRDARGSEIWY